jgi:hypothetical protein
MIDLSKLEYVSFRNTKIIYYCNNKKIITKVDDFFEINLITHIMVIAPDSNVYRILDVLRKQETLTTANKFERVNLGKEKKTNNQRTQK